MLFRSRKAMEQLNNRITALDADRFITMSVIVFDVASSKATIVIAGHMPPIHYRADGSIHEPGGEEDIGGPALGIESDIKFDSVEITLEPGETLTMYTDGIFEAPNADGQQFSMERIRKILQGAKSDVNLAGKTVIAQVTDHIVGCAQEDDMCMVIVGRDEVSSYDTAPDIA